MTTLAQVVVGFKQLLAQGHKDKTKAVKDNCYLYFTDGDLQSFLTEVT